MNARRGWGFLVATMVLELVAGIFFLVHGFNERSAISPIPGGVRTEGSVVSVRWRCFKGCTYQPTIAYTVGQQRYTFVGAMHANYLAVGSPDPIVYDPSHPATAHDLGGSEGAWIGSVVIGAILVAFPIATSALVAWARRRFRRLHQPGTLG